MKLIYTGQMQPDGSLHIYRRNELIEMLQTHFADKKLQITFEVKRKKRSLMQNAYYWGVVVPIVYKGLLDAGWQMDLSEVHTYLKQQFNIREFVNKDTGEIISSIGSTAKMSTSEMMDYFAEIKQWAAEFLNVYIPDPNEQTELEIKTE